MKGFAALAALLLTACQISPGAWPTSPARSVILFVGDGMGVSTVTAARIYAGQQQGRSGEENYLSFERFPHVALIKTYNTNQQVPDSAGTMTAMVTGEKTRAGVLSVNADVPRGDCAAALAGRLPTLLELAEQAGLATGVISTARITHATPAATYAHSADRNWEADSTMPEAARLAGCRDIARQLVEFGYGDGIEVVLGGGRLPFLPATEQDPESGAPGVREDNRNLIAEWTDRPDRRYVWDRGGFDALPRTGDDQVLGLFQPSHMRWEADRERDAGGEPSLAEMTAFAIDRLSGGSGYFLMVEGGRIDHAHHAGNAARALIDTVAFADAVQTAVDRTGPETLIVVTADHSHTLIISGYPRRGNPILGIAKGIDGKPMMDTRGIPYTTLSYANGPGFREHPAAPQDPEALDFRQPAGIPLTGETHAGEDVAAYATGPGSERIAGVMDQNEIFSVMHDVLFGPARP